MVNTTGTTYSLMSQLQNLKKARNKFEETTNMMTSNFQAQDFFSLTKANKLSKYSELQKSYRNVQDYITNISLVKDNLDTIDNSLTSLIQISSDLVNLSVQAIGVNRPFLQMTVICQNALANIQNNLNAQSSNGYVFSGTMTNTESVKPLVNNSNVVAGQVTYNYYQGNFVVVNIQASDALTINYGITANNTAFQQLIGGANLLIQGDNSYGLTIIEQAQATLKQSLQNLNQLRTSNRNYMNALDNVKTSQELTLMKLQEQLSDLVVTDQIAAATQLAIDQQNLQAAYQAYPQLINNNLADFLR